MTIHTDWARLLHEECPEAFLKNIPRLRYGVGVIDGHLQLMCLHTKLPSWDAFIKYLFLKPIKTLFDAGCPRVVLCFDCYDNVPVYKNMTQLKRAGKTAQQVCVFDASQDLPKNIPDDPMLYLMNRDFKIKVIDMVCKRIPQMIELQGNQEFIIDYKRVIQYNRQNKMIPVSMEDLKPMGESDVKFIRYVNLFGNALIHAIDGDYLAIALLYYAKYAEICNTNKIYIYRQLSSLKTKQSSSVAPPAKKLKLQQNDDGSGFNYQLAVKVVNTTSPYFDSDRKKTEKCWVDMQLLFATISQCVWQSLRSVGGRPINCNTMLPFTDGDAVYSAVFLMLCAGTDFSRGFPFIGPKRIWEALPLISTTLLQITSNETPSANADDDLSSLKRMQEKMIMDAVIAKIYKCVYANHLSGKVQSLKNMRDQILRSTLSDSTKAKLPTEEQTVTTIKNVLWVMEYWQTHNDAVKTPLDGSNGFVLCPTTRKITFSDLVQ
jgi:hypothetical protein